MSAEYIDLPLKQKCDWCYGAGYLVFSGGGFPVKEKQCNLCDGNGFTTLKELEIEDKHELKGDNNCERNYTQKKQI